MREGCLGLSNLEVGRIAASVVAMAARRPGKVAVFVGGVEANASVGVDKPGLGPAQGPGDRAGAAKSARPARGEDRMPAFALNHMTVARLSYADLLDVAERTGCVGVEVRTDLPQPLFDGLDPAEAGAMARDRGLRLLAVAEVRRFDDWSGAKAEEALALARVAQACGAEAVALIPRNDGEGFGERRGALRAALGALAPLLEDHGLVGLVEPLGFASCALRLKSEAVEAIEDLGLAGRFRLVHDTFHHHLAGGGPLFPAHTGLVHVSGVADPAPGVDEMGDRHRVLVDGRDRLGTVAQLRALEAAGYRGPASFEAFAPETHAEADPAGALGRSMDAIREGLAARAA